MTTEAITGATGHCRYTYRLRLSSSARTALAAEWDRVRWVWNECVAKSKAVHALNEAVGFVPEREIQKPEKKALLSFCTRAQFEAALAVAA